MKEKILIFFSVGIGDALMVTPSLAELYNKHSNDYEFHALSLNPVVSNILQRLNYFEDITTINAKKDGVLKALSVIWKLRKEKFDKSFLIFPSNHFKYRIFNYLIGAKRRYAHKYSERVFPEFDFLSTDFIPEDRNLHSAEENYQLFESGFNTKLPRTEKMRLILSDEDKRSADNFLLEYNISGKICGIHAGSDTFKNLIHKRWSWEKYRELCKKLTADGFTVLIFGGGEEIELNTKIADGLDKVHVVKNRPFTVSAALIKRCNVFVANDSGLMHTAAALEVPVCAIFGMTSSVYTKPYKSKHIIIKKDYPCIPCFEYSRKPLVCTQDKTYRCMLDIEIDEVYDGVKKLL